MNKYFWFREKLWDKWSSFMLVEMSEHNGEKLLWFFGNEEEKYLSEYDPEYYELVPLKECPPDL